MMHCEWLKAITFSSKLGFKQHDKTLTKEQQVTTKIIKLFSNERILQQNSVSSYEIHLYFP